VLDDKGERLLSLAGQFNSAPKSIYSELATSDIKFPTIKLSDGKEVVLSPGNYGACWRRAEAGGPGQGGVGARRRLRLQRQHLRRDLQRRAAARLVPGPARNFPTTLDAALDGNAIRARWSRR
jgi:oligoendopeptidase F